MAIQYRHLEQQNGVTRIAGHRMRAFDIMDIRRQGPTPEEIADDYSLPLGVVYEALAYATDHPDEMGAVNRRDQEAYYGRKSSKTIKALASPSAVSDCSIDSTTRAASPS